MATKKITTSKNKKEGEVTPAIETPKLHRSESSKIIAGVCGGLGEYFDVDPTIIRIVFVLMTIFGGSGILIYIILWLVIPSENSNQQLSQRNVKDNAKELRSKVQTFAHDIKRSSESKRSNTDSRPWWGLLIVILGAAFLMSNYGLFDFSEFSKLWPLALIALGLLILLKK